MFSTRLLRYIVFTLLCRDPDSGKFYGVNTTWPSTTFCGNYHCKLRKKNLTEIEYVPIRQINISDHDLQIRTPKKEQLFDKNSLFVKLAPKVEKINVSEFSNLVIPVEKNNISSPLDLETLSKEAEDRYLNEKEIKSIASILHTVKKSDLDAIIEIYNLAQDIYKEIDKPSSDDVSNVKQNMASQTKETNIDKNQISYWYEPMRVVKQSFDIAPADIERLETGKIRVSTTKPATSKTAKPAKKIHKYDVTATSKDFTKLPYYYPMTTFQRLSSYVHQPVTYIAPYIPSPTAVVKSQQDASKYQKNINPSFYLPYPFLYIPHNNKTHLHGIYYQNQLKLDDSIKNKIPIENAVLINPDLENMPGMSLKAVNTSNKESELSSSPEKTSKIKYNHDWQTDPISAQILNEVRANADKKLLRPISLRKKISLERVGKVLSVDDITKRIKRSVPEEEKMHLDLFEVYLDKTTCKADSDVLGFFRYGNMSKPFPDCCPQRIS